MRVPAVLLNLNFVGIKQKALLLKFEKLRKIFDEFSVNYQKTVDDFYWNKQLIIVMPQFS